MITLSKNVFYLLGPNAFDDWLYCVNYSLSNAVSSLISNCTRHLNITLFGLQSDTLYEFTLSAIGPGGEKTTPSSFVFQTKTVGKFTKAAMAEALQLPFEYLKTKAAHKLINLVARNHCMPQSCVLDWSKLLRSCLPAKVARELPQCLFQTTSCMKD